MLRGIHVRLLLVAGLGLVVALPVAASQTKGPTSTPATLTEPDAATKASVTKSYGQLPLSFEANLGQADPQVKFLSLEPLIGPLDDLRLDGIDWAIVGGESGPRARPIDRDWVRSIRAQCEEADVAFFFKQWGGVRKHDSGRELDGRTWDAFPNVPMVTIPIKS